jgi:membrane protease YdiL (CAAX protease family)
MNLPLGENLSEQKGGLAFTVNVCIYLVLSLIATIIISVCGLYNQDGTVSDVGIYIEYLVSPIAITATLSLAFTVGKVPVKDVLKVKCKPKYFGIALLIIFGLLFSLSSLNGLFIEFLKLFGYQQRITSSSLPNFNGWHIVPVLLVIAVLPALFEEALFRGLILGGAEEGSGTIKSIFIVGFLFSLFHGSAEQTIYQFICGCLFALVAIRSRSLAPTVLMHFINNAIIIIFSALNLFDDGGNLSISGGVSVAITLLSAVCLVVGTVLLIFDKAPTKQQKNGGTVRFFFFAALGILVMAIVWILGLFGL